MDTTLLLMDRTEIQHLIGTDGLSPSVNFIVTDACNVEMNGDELQTLKNRFTGKIDLSVSSDKLPSLIDDGSIFNKIQNIELTGTKSKVCLTYTIT